MLGDYLNAKTIMDEFPPSQEYSRMEVMRPLYEEIRKFRTSQDIGDDPLDAAFHNAISLTIRGNLPAAMDGMLDILRQDKHYRNDEGRKFMLGLFELLGDEHPLTQQYRKELASVLF
jgi:putative thioredoxin